MPQITEVHVFLGSDVDARGNALGDGGLIRSDAVLVYPPLGGELVAQAGLDISEITFWTRVEVASPPLTMRVTAPDDSVVVVATGGTLSILTKPATPPLEPLVVARLTTGVAAPAVGRDDLPVALRSTFDALAPDVRIHHDVPFPCNCLPWIC